VLNRSFVGGFLLNKELGGSADYNRVYGADASFTFHRNLTVLGMWAASGQPGAQRDNWIGNTSVWWETDFLAAGAEIFYVQPNFRNDMGFLRRKDWRRHTASFAISPRPKSGPIRRIWINPRYDYETDSQWRLVNRLHHLHSRVEFHSGDSFGILPHHYFERLDRPYALRYEFEEDDDDAIGTSLPRRLPAVMIPTGDHNWWFVRLRYTASPARRISGNFEVAPWRGYYGGNLMEYNFTPRVKVTDRLAVEVGYRLNDGRIGQTAFTDHVLNFKVLYNFNNQWLTTTTIQYNNTDAFSGLNFRLNYIFRPGDDFFLVYNEGRRLGDAFHGQKDRTLQAKFTYSFDY